MQEAGIKVITIKGKSVTVNINLPLVHGRLCEESRQEGGQTMSSSDPG